LVIIIAIIPIITIAYAIGSLTNTSNAINKPNITDIEKVKNSIQYFEKDGRCYAVTFWATAPMGFGHSITQISCK